MPDELTKNELRDRWETPEGQAFREEIIRQLQSEECKYKVDWKNLEVEVGDELIKWTKFEGVEELINHNYSFADLRGIDLVGEELINAKLRRSHFESAILEEVRLDGANLRAAHFQGANLKNAILCGSNLAHSNLSCVILNNANLTEVNLYNANLSGANLHNAKFTLKTWGMRIEELKRKTNFRSLWFVLNVVLIFYNVCWFVRRLFPKAKDKPDLKNATKLESAQLKNVKLDGDPILYRKMLDEQYLDSFAKEHLKIYPFWLLTSNCGRSVLLLLGWTIFFGIFFGAIFANYSCPSWFPDFVETINPNVSYNGNPQTLWWQPYYMSFVTMTTLGLASAEPVNDAAFWWHTLQNMFGYIWLGYLIAVLGSKLTRRSA